MPLPIQSSSEDDHETLIQKSIAGGFYHHAACVKVAATDEYRTIQNHPVGLRPDSSLRGSRNRWVVYDRIDYVSHQYMRHATVVEIEWLLEYPYMDRSRLPLTGKGEPRLSQLGEELRKAGRL
ncbi:uncharacterized protein B0J16DRAFT_341014 [Fusarium flagelliforme]|uniref:uncharacterized protein n=1 Tax=Fusarium flagelliforme TaxID=2675880 RepID=UPI001E8DAACD|nr:uncharacterized protein B0J16DRAFT_341014 [Fusarium flagelliforme]KAH7185192.1 hypothetical protein B0J16DRAFT_341014 [Fusarium flagelliforme]